MTSRWVAVALAVVCGLAFAFAGCSHNSGGGSAQPPTARDEMLKPTRCGVCHQLHYSDWLISMHAYASDDPVFVAMNKRGQRETNGALGTFCVNCHAPMAVRDKKTTDGLNLDQLPPEYHGITCFFCHSIASVDGSHNAAVTLSDDLVMRGEIPDPTNPADPPPAQNPFHQSMYSPLHDEQRQQSAAMCGACHDIVVPHTFGIDAGANDSDAGTHIERTFAEWKASAFAGPGGNTCTAGACHMVSPPDKQLISIVTTAPKRYYHGHDFPAVDVQLMPGTDAAAPAPIGVQLLLSNALQGALCVTEMGGIRVSLDAVNLGHNFPSGAAQDRRLWAQVVAYQGTDVIYQSGSVALGDPAFDAGADPDMWLLRDCVFDGTGKQVHMFWQAAPSTNVPAGYEGNELPPLPTFVGNPIAQRMQYFPRDGTPLLTKIGKIPDRVTLTLWVQPIGSDVLNDLIASKDLDPSVAAAMPILPVPLGLAQLDGGTIAPGPPQLEWTLAAAKSPDGGVTPFQDTPGDGTTAYCVGSLPMPAPARATNHKWCSP